MTTRLRSSLITTFSLLVLLLTAPAVYANGFLVYDQGVDAMGKASAVAGGTSEPNAVFYNPAGISFSKGYNFSLGADLIFTKVSFDPEGAGASTDGKAGFFQLAQLFATAELTDWLHIGIGGFTAFGLGCEWPNDWMGRANSIKSAIESFTINPVVSFKITDDLAIAVGLQVVRGTLDNTQGTPDGVGTARLGFAGWGFGGNIGIMYRVVPNKVSLGLSYRSRTKIPLDGGKVDFTVPSELNNFFPDQGASTSMTFPDIITFGVSFKPIETLTIGIDVNYIAWDSWDKTTIKFNNGFPTTTSEHKYHGIMMFRLGGEYETPIGLKVRAGVAFEQNPAPRDYLSPSLPDANYLDFTVGLRAPSFVKWLDLDLAYMFIWSMPSKAETGVESPVGVYEGFGNVVALMATFRFGQGNEPKPAPVATPAASQEPPLVAPSAEKP